MNVKLHAKKNVFSIYERAFCCVLRNIFLGQLKSSYLVELGIHKCYTISMHLQTLNTIFSKLWDENPTKDQNPFSNLEKPLAIFCFYNNTWKIDWYMRDECLILLHSKQHAYQKSSRNWKLIFIRLLSISAHTTA